MYFFLLYHPYSLPKIYNKYSPLINNRLILEKDRSFLLDTYVVPYLPAWLLERYALFCVYVPQYSLNQCVARAREFIFNWPCTKKTKLQLSMLFLVHCWGKDKFLKSFDFGSIVIIVTILWTFNVRFTLKIFTSSVLRQNVFSNFRIFNPRWSPQIWVYFQEIPYLISRILIVIRKLTV